MEGPLEVWQGMMGIGGWTKKYFVLFGSVLECYDRRVGLIETQIHLKVATLTKSRKKEKQFTVMSGANWYKLRAASEELRAKWMEALYVN